MRTEVWLPDHTLGQLTYVYRSLPGPANPLTCKELAIPSKAHTPPQGGRGGFRSPGGGRDVESFRES